MHFNVCHAPVPLTYKRLILTVYCPTLQGRARFVNYQELAALSQTLDTDDD